MIFDFIIWFSNKTGMSIDQSGGILTTLFVFFTGYLFRSIYFLIINYIKKINNKKEIKYLIKKISDKSLNISNDCLKIISLYKKNIISINNYDISEINTLKEIGYLTNKKSLLNIFSVKIKQKSFDMFYNNLDTIKKEEEKYNKTLNIFYKEYKKQVITIDLYNQDLESMLTNEINKMIDPIKQLFKLNNCFDINKDFNKLPNKKLIDFFNLFFIKKNIDHKLYIDDLFNLFNQNNNIFINNGFDLNKIRRKLIDCRYQYKMLTNLETQLYEDYNNLNYFFKKINKLFIKINKIL